MSGFLHDFEDILEMISLVKTAKREVENETSLKLKNIKYGKY